jgi:hypothetical protein
MLVEGGLLFSGMFENGKGNKKGKKKSIYIGGLGGCIYPFEA